MLSRHRQQYWNLLAKLAIAAIGIIGFAIASFGQSVQFFDSMAATHGLKRESPHGSVQMIGTVDREGKTEAFRLFANEDEQVRIEYGRTGKDILVMRQKMSFRDDGEKLTYDSTPPGFAQLDITGLFFVEQLGTRPVNVDSTREWTGAEGSKMQRFHITNDRSEKHKGTFSVQDSLDVYINEAGLLTAISRSFYEGQPEAYTLAFTFSDYRKTGDALLPYQIDVYIKGLRRQTYRVEQYQFDVTQEKSLFNPWRTR